MARLSVKAIKLLRKVKSHILAEPKRFQMATWGFKTKTAPCGTTACIGGWIHILSSKNPKAFYEMSKDEFAMAMMGSGMRAARALGFIAQPWLLDKLFQKIAWPKQFRRGREGSVTLAKAAAERIEYFIKTGE